MASLGQELKRERELRGISLKEISSSTKINMKFLNAIEEDRLDVLPGEFFIKAILRAYAKCLGLDEDYVLNKYHEISFLQQQTLENQNKKGGNLQKVSRKNRIFRLFIPLAVLLFVVAFSMISIISRPEKTKKLPEKAQTSSVFEEPKASLPPVTETIVEEEKGLNLRISFLDETWIQVYADGELRLDSIKKPGEEFQIKALSELVLNLGNAGGISYTVNGRKGKSFGPSGAVARNIKMTLENWEQFLLSDRETKQNETENRL